MAERVMREAASFAKGYKPAEGDHPDLESRVTMYRRAVKGGDKRVVAAHARTLVRFARNVGAIGDTSSSSDDGPSKAELQAEAEALGLAKGGSKAELEARIAEHKAQGE